ncbi:MAG: helix-turn-helix domain-containing protein [Bacteroidales bacterium]
MVFVSKNSDCQIELQEDCDLLLLRYSNSLIPNTHLLSESFYQLKSQITYECKGIPIKPEMKSFISQLLFYLNAGINSRYLHEIKQIELYLIFKYFYSKEEVVRLFYHSIGQEPEFTDAVLSNYKNSKTAKELAAKLGYGEKTFRKIFKYNFGTTPYRWMQQQIAREIQFKLFDKRIPLKEIMFDFGFTDSSHFNVYCKRNFGHPPSFIRNQMRNIPLQPIATKPKPIK